jgi:hypothetical protein
MVAVQHPWRRLTRRLGIFHVAKSAPSARARRLVVVVEKPRPLVAANPPHHVTLSADEGVVNGFNGQRDHWRPFYCGAL